MLLRPLIACTCWACLLTPLAAQEEAEEPDLLESQLEPDVPPKYVLDYPPATRFCPPVQTFFFEVTRTAEIINGKRVLHKPNGGYGYVVARTLNNKPVYHVGADVGWHRPESPVYAVAAGVVRGSFGPPSPDAPDSPGKAASRPFSWSAGESGVIVEHRFATGGYFTTMYLHLANRRQVKIGDIVAAGQQIGTIGRKVSRGPPPHVHVAVREGRMAEPGCILLGADVNEKKHTIRLVRVDEEEIEIAWEPAASVSDINYRGQRYPITVRDGRSYLSASILWRLRSRKGFELGGIPLSLEGWRDPVAFLRAQGADLSPAPFAGR